MSLHRTLFFAALLTACSGSEPEPTPDETGTPEDTAGEDTETEDLVDTVDEYLAVYCGDFAVECGLYADVETCIETVYDAWMSTCEVVDPVAMNNCAEWIAGITCEEEGWLADCDAAVEC